jgi:AraC-like DNA-binding protein
LTVVRNTRPTPPIPAVLTPSLCLILHGAKRLHVGAEVIDCGPGKFLASVIHLPASAQIVGAAPSNPYVGLRLDLASAEIAAVVTEAGLTPRPASQPPSQGAFIGQADAALLDLFARLLHLLDRPGDVAYLAALLKRELIYTLLAGDYGHLFFQPVFFEPAGGGIGPAIAWIEANYARAFTVAELAATAHLSVSSLHHKFKAVTAMGPLQYQKQLRLQAARRLLLSGAADATTAAFEVGYESPSQFSREYRRLFGQPPLKDIQALRQLAAGRAFDLD